MTGAIAMGLAVAGCFFLRYWRESRDRFFGFFALAFFALAINRAIVEGGERFTVAMGIDYGRFLLVDDCDCYGDPVNVACKLGEDVAESGEVLLTAAARACLGPTFPHALRETTVSVSGLEVHVFAVEAAR